MDKKQAIINAIKADFKATNKREPKDEKELAQFVQKKGGENYIKKLASKLVDTQEQAQKALHGAKLNYLKFLKNKCAEDEEVVYFKTGGSVTCGCKKKEQGGEVPAAKQGSAVEKFKARKVEMGTKVPPTKKKDEEGWDKHGNYIVSKKKIAERKKQLEANKNEEGEADPKRQKPKTPTTKIGKAKIDHMKKGNAIEKFKAAKCGSKMKEKFQQGGNLQKRIWKFGKPLSTQQAEYMSIKSIPDEKGRNIEIHREISKDNGRSDTTYIATVEDPTNLRQRISYYQEGPKIQTTNYKSPKQVIANNGFNSWGDYYKHLLSLKK